MNIPKRAFNHQRVRFSAVGRRGSIESECSYLGVRGQWGLQTPFMGD